MSSSTPNILPPKTVFENYFSAIRDSMSNTSLDNSFFTILANVISHESVHITGFCDITEGNGQAVLEFDDMHVSLSYNQDHIFQAVFANSTDKKMQQLLISEGIPTLVELSSEESESTIIDLNFDGRRWEGCAKNGNPFGYGYLFDEKGNLEYEGFIQNQTCICYGKHYYTDVECISYSGGYCDGKRCGKGISYDRFGELDYEGNWYNNFKQASLTNALSQFPLLFITIERLNIPSQYLLGDHVTNLLVPSMLVHLQSIEIGEKCFPSIQRFIVDGLPSLQTISIGNNSLHNPSYDKGSDCVFQISYCPKVHTISLGQSIGFAMSIVELNDLPSLKEMSMDKYCFMKSRSFSLMST